MKSKQFYMYLATNQNGSVIYTGITNDLVRRMWQHKNHVVESFTSKYNVTKLVYYEIFTSAEDAITREKQIKGGSRNKKLELIKSVNPLFKDLYEEIIK